MERLGNANCEDPELSQRVTLIYRNPPLRSMRRTTTNFSVSLRPCPGGAAKTASTRKGAVIPYLISGSSEANSGELKKSISEMSSPSHIFLIVRILGS